MSTEQRNSIVLGLSIKDEQTGKEVFGMEVREGLVSVADTFALEADLIALGQARREKQLAKMAAASVA
jgi:hypothetical protein